MILNLVILLIFCVSKIYSDESEEGKYIDLLPEDEKREFLEKVARRILEEVESKDIVKKSGELSDGQLNKHDSYVSQVMKEEGKDMMKKHENDTKLMKADIRSDNAMAINQDKIESGGRVENREENGHLEHIDLTLRQGKASIREHENEKRSVSYTLAVNNKLTTEESTTVISLIVNEETSTPTVTYETTSRTDAVGTEDKNNDGNVSIEITIDSNHTKKQPVSSNEFKPVSDINIPVQVFYDNVQFDKASVKENLKETTSKPITQDVKQDGGEYIYQSREEDRKDETRKTVTVMENYEPKKCWSSEESIKTSTLPPHLTTIKQDFVTDESHRVVTNCDGKPIKFETTSQWIIIDPTDVTGGIYEPIDITRTKNNNGSDIDQKMIENGIITTTEVSTLNLDTVDATSPIVDNINSTQLDIPGDKTISVKEEEKNHIDIKINTTNVYEFKTTEVIYEIHTTTTKPNTIGTPATAKPEIIDVQNTENKSLIHENPEKLTILISTTNNRFEEKKLKSLSLSLSDAHSQQLEDSQKNLLELESNYNEHKIKELKVYEIPPGKPLFVENKPNIPKDITKINNQDVISESPSVNGEQPSYVPIYNYSPNNAYFNAYNRLGPNYEDEEGTKNSGLINTNILRVKADSSSISFESREKVSKKYYFYNSGPSIKKIRSKILLPPSMPKHKKKKYNPQIYLDDYTDTEESTYFRKEKMHKPFTRNRNKKSKKHKKGQSNEDSMQVDEMYVRGTIKNHIDAVRNYLSKKNYFQFYESPSDILQKKKDKKSLIWTNPKKDKTKNDKADEISSTQKKDSNRVEDDRLNKLKDKGLNKIKEEGERLKEKGNDKVKEAADDLIRDDNDRNENKHRKVRKKLKRLLRAHAVTRYGKPKPKRPKTGTVDGFQEKSPKYGHGIDLDYYFGRTGPDESNSNSVEMSFSSSEESSLETGQVTIGKLGSVYYSRPRQYYVKHRRNTDNNPENNNAQTDQTSKKDTSRDTKSKITMDDFNLVKNMSVAVDLVPNVLMMQKLVGLGRSGDNKNLKIYLTVLSNFIEIENKALLQYDWLGSTVDIQSALRKLIDLTEQLTDGDFDVHPADWELFKYVFYIYETVDLDVKKKNRKMLHGKILQNRMRVKKDKIDTLKLLPMPKKSGNRKLKIIGPYFSLRTQKKVYAKKVQEKQKLLSNIIEFQEFLKSLLDNLNDLHDAIKHIGMVSKYKTAKWFKNLKEIYLYRPRKKEILTILLHLSMDRVINLLEESAKDGVERSFVSYVSRERNALKIQRTKEELSFVLSILRDLEKLEN